MSVVVKLDGGTQLRVNGTDEEHVDHLAEQIAKGRKLPPPIVYIDKSGSYWPADGHHRIAALCKSGTQDNPLRSPQRRKERCDLGSREEQS
jgi:hypothetical protein